MWGYNIRVVTVPSFLAFAFLGLLIYPHSPTDFNIWFLAIWITSASAPLSSVQGQFFVPDWSNILIMTGLPLPMTVNALVTGLIVFRIFKVFQEVKTSTADSQNLGDTSGSTLRRVIFILIESGMALFSIQLARLVTAILASIVPTDAAYAAYYPIVGINEMLTVIIRSVIATLFY